MAQYIDKSAVVAEIEDKINKYTKRGEESDAKRDGYGMYWGGVISCLNEIRSFLDTLEVKEADLNKEIEEVKHNYKVDNNQHTSICSADIEWLAKHFFELGLKANNTSNSFDATVCKVGNTYLKEMDKDAIAKALESYKDGDKVKVLIIKEENNYDTRRKRFTT